MKNPVFSRSSPTIRLYYAFFQKDHINNKTRIFSLWRQWERSTKALVKWKQLILAKKGGSNETFKWRADGILRRRHSFAFRVYWWSMNPQPALIQGSGSDSGICSQNSRKIEWSYFPHTSSRTSPVHATMWPSWTRVKLNLSSLPRNWLNSR